MGQGRIVRQPHPLTEAFLSRAPLPLPDGERDALLGRPIRSRHDAIAVTELVFTETSKDERLSALERSALRERLPLLLDALHDGKLATAAIFARLVATELEAGRESARYGTWMGAVSAWLDLAEGPA